MRAGNRRRLERLEKVVLALVGKVRKMGVQHEESFKTLQQGVTDAGRDLKSRLQDLVAAHDSGDNAKFEEKAAALDEAVNQVQNFGHSNNHATKAGQSPSGTVGASTGDLPQGKGPVQD